jgi:hypothetical protein
MSKNILWQNYSPAQIRKMIRDWKPEGKSDVVAEAAKAAGLTVRNVRVTKTPAADLKGMPKVQRQKHVGVDGEIKFVPHRDLWLGFFGGRPAVKARTQEACQALLKKKFGIGAPEVKA